MGTLPCTLKHPELTDKIIGVFYDVYNELGHGFLESTYAEAMVVALESSSLRVSREVPIPVWFRGKKIGQYFADVIVQETILLELKAAQSLDKAHEAQLLHYLRATDIESGFFSTLASVPNSAAFSSTTKERRPVQIRANPWLMFVKN